MAITAMLVVAVGIVVAGSWIAMGSARSTVRLAEPESIPSSQVTPKSPVLSTVSVTPVAPPVSAVPPTPDGTPLVGVNTGSDTVRAQVPLKRVPTNMPADQVAPAAPSPPSPTTPIVAYVPGSDVVMDQSSGHGCKAWMNSRTPGPYAQGLVQSWGDDCEMSLWRSTDGGKTFSIESGKHRLSSATATTYFYWAGPGDLAKVCLTDYKINQTSCGKSFGG